MSRNLSTVNSDRPIPSGAETDAQPFTAATPSPLSDSHKRGNRGMIRYLVLLVLLLPGAVLADDPVVTSISVMESVTGDGKRASPFVFNATTICIVMIKDEAAKDVAWDLEDGPPKAFIVPGGKAVVFPLTGGEYLIQASWTGGKSKAWLVIHSGPAPPPTPLTISQKVAKALTGPRATEDAVALEAAATKVLSEMATYRDGADLLPKWGAYLAAAGWVKGSRPEIAAMIGAEIPAGSAVAFTAADKARLTILFEGILTGSKAVLK